MRKKEVELLTEPESLERLLYRLPADHPQRKFLEVEHYRKAAGTRGENRLKRKFVEFDLEESYQFLRNINLSIGAWRVQMDALLLTARGAIVIESKNISGRLHFDEATGEFSRTDAEGKRTIMEDPTIQLNKHMRFLRKFFKLHCLDLPVDGLVVFTPKQCEFLSKPKTTYVCKTYQIIDYLYRILQTFPQKVVRQDLSEIEKLLQHQQTPFKHTPLCQKYFIEASDLVTGILCTNCKKHSMIRKQKTGWICSKCHVADEHAVHYAVQEYFSLIHDQLNNKRLREFCNLNSTSAASRILASFDFEITGSLKNRTYTMKQNS